jgi:hypothetical protein
VARDVRGGPWVHVFAPADRRWRGRSGSRGGSVGERAVTAARAALRAALKPYRKFSHASGGQAVDGDRERCVPDRSVDAANSRTLYLAR